MVCAAQTAVEFERRPHAPEAGAPDEHVSARRPTRLCRVAPVPWLCGLAHHCTETRADGTTGSGTADCDAREHLLLRARSV